MTSSSSPLSKLRAYEDLRGADLSGEDLTDYSFAYARMQGANLSGACLDGTQFGCANLRGANLEDAEGLEADFRGAILDEANLTGADMHSWHCQGGSMVGAVLNNAQIRETDLMGVSLENADIDGVSWMTPGPRTRGIVLPERIDFSTIKWGSENHDLVARLVRKTFGDQDLEMCGIAEFLASRFEYGMPCWENFTDTVIKRWSHRIEDLEACFNESSISKMHLYERWKLGMEMWACKDLDDYKKLRETSEYYELLGPNLDRVIRILTAAQAKTN